MSIISMEKNIKEKLKYLAEKIPSMHVEVIEKSSLVNTKLSSDTFNTVFGGNINYDSAKKIFNYYKENNLPMAWWIGPSSTSSLTPTILEKAGFLKDEVSTGMKCDLNTILATPVFTALDIRICHSESDFLDFANVLSSVFIPIDTQILPFYQIAATLPADSRQKMTLFVGYEKGKPVACSSLFVTNVAGIYDIATRPEKRNLGYGSAMLHQTLLEVKKRNYKQAILQASKDGLNLYKRLGFQEICEFTIWTNKESLPKKEKI